MNFLLNKKALINYFVWFLSLLPLYIVKYNLFKVRAAGEEIAGAPENIHPRMQEYVIYEGILYFVIGVILTFLVQYAIEKYVKPDYSFWIKSLIIVSLFVSAMLVYQFTMFPICGQIQEFLVDKNGTEGATIGTQILNFVIFMTWYFVFELFRMYDKNKKIKIDKANLEANLKESKLNALKGQINPHFMFNSLNNIRGLMLEDVEKSRLMITNLAEMLRYSLTESAKDSTPLEKELEIVEYYIELSKIQLEERLTVNMNIDPKYYSKLIPPMIMQLLVENAIKHGISNLPEGGEVDVFADKIGDDFVIRVSNSGRLTIDKNSTKLGLKNIEERLEILYGSKAQFTLKEVDDKVIAEIKIPY